MGDLEHTDEHSHCEHLKGVRCEVTNCKYNGENQHCTAKEIKVGPHFASCQAETLCATFKLR